MSYAQVAAKGPKQSPEEARAPPLPEVEHSDDTTESLVDVDSMHVSTVASDYESQPVKTDTQALRQELEAEDRELEDQRRQEEEYQRMKREAKAKAQEAKEKALNAKNQAKEHAAEVKEHAVEAKNQAVEAKNKAAAEAKKEAERLSNEAKAAGRDLQRNADNPVVMGNAIVVAALSAALGFGAYRKYSAGELTWKVVGAWAGVVGLFAAGDYYLSQYLFKNRYPKK